MTPHPADVAKAWRKNKTALLRIWARDRRPYLYGLTEPKPISENSTESEHFELKMTIVRSEFRSVPDVVEVHYGIYHLDDILLE